MKISRIEECDRSSLHYFKSNGGNSSLSSRIESAAWLESPFNTYEARSGNEERFETATSCLKDSKTRRDS